MHSIDDGFVNRGFLFQPFHTWSSLFTLEEAKSGSRGLASNALVFLPISKMYYMLCPCARSTRQQSLYWRASWVSVFFCFFFVFVFFCFCFLGGGEASM